MNQESYESGRQLRPLDGAELVGVEGGAAPTGRIVGDRSTEPHDLLKRDYPKIPPICGKPLL